MDEIVGNWLGSFCKINFYYILVRISPLPPIIAIPKCRSESCSRRFCRYRVTSTLRRAIYA